MTRWGYRQDSGVDMAQPCGVRWRCAISQVEAFFSVCAGTDGD